jgi:hypothetical protein
VEPGADSAESAEKGEGRMTRMAIDAHGNQYLVNPAVGKNQPIVPLIPRDGTEILVMLESGRDVRVKWCKEMELWEETAGDNAYPDCDIIRWVALHWQCMPGTPGSEL